MAAYGVSSTPCLPSSGQRPCLLAYWIPPRFVRLCGVNLARCMCIGADNSVICAVGWANLYSYRQKLPKLLTLLFDLYSFREHVSTSVHERSIDLVYQIFALTLALVPKCSNVDQGRIYFNVDFSNIIVIIHRHAEFIRYGYKYEFSILF